MADPALPPYIVVTGHGRSGTNMVLDLLDCHRNTLCRNEPNELKDSAFMKLGDPMFGDPALDNFAVLWQDAVATAARSNGVRDRFDTNKDFFRSALHARLGQAVMSRRRLRDRILRRRNKVAPEEWPCSGLYFDPAARDRALPVLKILLAPDWITRAQALFPGQRVVHVIRRPEGFIQSWWSRYVTVLGGGPEQVFSDNKHSLIRILEHFGRADEFPAAYSIRALVVSELWRWRYMNEIILDRLDGSGRYIVAPYDAVMRDRLTWAGKIYDFAGIELTPESRSAVENMQNTLFGKRKPNGLDKAMVSAAVEDVMAGSAWRAALVTPA